MKKLLVLLTFVALLPSCSVVMASNKSGIDIDSIQNAHTRTQLIAMGAEPINADHENERLVETYKIQKEKGSIARAFMHGLLDLSTCFLWEIAGTPIESSLCQEKH
jgi:hypothetical protein